jgi:hypothetical protein
MAVVSRCYRGDGLIEFTDYEALLYGVAWGRECEREFSGEGDDG